MGKIRRIWIDAGHGGIDSGAINANGTKESDRVLILGLELEKQLREQGFETLMTRTKDDYVSLVQRTDIENRGNCDLAVSLHMNGFNKPSANGIEIWVHSRASKFVMDWAEDTLKNLINVANQTNRGVHKGFRGNPDIDYHVNRETKSASMLIELGFVTNLDDLKDMINNTPDFAKGIVKSICNTLNIEYKENVNEKYNAIIGKFKSESEAKQFIDKYAKPYGLSGDIRKI